MNKVILMGRLTKDVELRQTPTGVNLARFTIAVNRRFAKEGQQQADFINCVAWRQTGEFIARYFRKGNMIAVAGRIEMRYILQVRSQRIHIVSCNLQRDIISRTRIITNLLIC